ncbi:MAG: hypothetical protein L3J70_11245 [Gammaproteobacteria bacterium]|nr:hypothetical protein [Gammaproteobacteria bacterium]
MAVKLTSSFFLVIILAIFSGSCNGQSSNLDETDAFNISINNFKKAKINLEKKIEECDKNRIIISKNAFKNVELTNEEWKVSLFVLSAKAEDSCEQGKRGEFVVAASIYRETAKHYEKKATLADPYSENLMFGHYWKKLEMEAKYLNVSKKKRNLLENLSEINKPFHLFETLSNLGVE